VLGLKHGFAVLKKISTPYKSFWKAMNKHVKEENMKTRRNMAFTKADFAALRTWKGN
jgi:hypothetical protein